MLSFSALSRHALKAILFTCFALPVFFSAGHAGDTHYFMRLSDNWDIAGDLPKHALLISLQGVANADAPRLYFIYGEKWDYNFTPSLFRYYQDSRGMTFRELSSADEALAALARHASGYVVWDTSARTSLIVAFTAAGLHQAVVVTGDQIPLAEKHGLNKKEDFRGRFNGKSDLEIYEWAYREYWSRCNKSLLVYMGGEGGRIMKPGVADFGIHQKAFFIDASTNPRDTAEYRFARKVFGGMTSMGLVMGWHSYGKDSEAQHVTLTSSYALRVEGLHTLPNMSFNHQIPFTPGFRFKNNHSVRPGSTPTAGKKVYLSCIQTDCLGLGAWTKPGRGEIPYAWEVTMNWAWLAPAMLQYFYDMATPNDYFVGSLSGPGYMYPKAIPAKNLPQIIDSAYSLMKQLDLNVFEIMDHSAYWQTEGVDDDLPAGVIETYFERMPGVIGIASGYRPGHTFALHHGKPFISYDYYLGEKREENEAVADLQELATLNPKRPYFLLMHVRQWSDIKRGKRILDRLGPDFEVVPLDVFMTLAARNPTFTTRYGEPLKASP
jgi:hypothetical protein